MEFVPVDLVSISDAAAVAAPFVTGIAISLFAHPHSLDRRLTVGRPKSRLEAPGRWHALAGSLALWSVACGAAVVVLHNAMSDVGPRVGAYRTGIATLILFAVAAVVAGRRRIAGALRHAPAHGTSLYAPRPNSLSRNFSNSLNALWSLKPKTWQRLHISLAIGAMLPLWWHCDIRRASTADRLLECAALSLLMSGFLGIAVTDLSRWRLLSPKISPRLSAALIRGLFRVHRGLALLAFTLITLHVLVVLYFAGV